MVDVAYWSTDHSLRSYGKMDRVSPSVRSRVMSSIPSGRTSLEARVLCILRRLDVGPIRRNVRGLPGRPDFVLPDIRTVVFADSCFWHGCPRHLRKPGSNTQYWRSKLDANRRRDRQASAALRRLGWRVVRVWEHSIQSDSGTASVIRRLAAIRTDDCR